jgi:rhodanese-related sulfurtransferase
MQEISPGQLKELLENKAEIQLIDVREPHEVAIVTLGGEQIPMGEIAHNLDKISKDNQVIIYCKSGKRSAAIVHFLEQQGYGNVFNLRGGILGYADEIDPSLTKY